MLPGLLRQTSILTSENYYFNGKQKKIASGHFHSMHADIFDSMTVCVCVVEISVFFIRTYYSRAQSTLKCNNDKHPETKTKEISFIHTHKTKRNFLNSITYNYQFQIGIAKKELSRKESIKRGGRDRRRKKSNQSN